MKTIYDISPLVSETFPVWPTSKPLIRKMESDIRKGSALTSSVITTSVHIGAHADAPSHYSLKGETIDQRSLEYYLGECQVIRVDVPKGSQIHYKHISGIKAPRVLFATNTFNYERAFHTDFAAIDPALMQQLAEFGVMTVGIDTPSVDLYESKHLESHQMALHYNMSLLEGLVLNDVPEGIYELIALPLKLKGFDASPVRAILRKI